MIQRLLVAALIGFATLAVYLPVRGHEFVHYDDFAYIVDNPRLNSALPPAELIRNLGAPALANWNPLTTLSFQLDHAVHGLSASGVHTTNLALHVLAALLLLLALESLTGRLWPSGFVAAVFALHPLHVESVAWAAERKDVLCAVFWMATLLLYSGWVRHPSAIRYLGVALSLLLALLAKPMAVTLPFVLLLLDVWPLGRIGNSTSPRLQGWQRCVAEKLPLFALTVAISVVTYLVQHDAGAVQELDRLALSARLANAATAYCAYLLDSLWPVGLAVFYPHVQQPIWWVASCAAALAAISALVLVHWRRSYLAVGWLWFLGTLVPVIGLVQVGLQSRADRYMYLPQIGLTIMLAWGAAELLARRRSLRPLVAGGALIAVAALAWGSSAQLAFWRDSAALFARAAAVVPNNYFAHRGLADAHLRASRLELAGQHYQLAMDAKPRWAIPQIGLADVLVRQGRLGAALPRFERALELEPSNPRALTNFGLALLTAGRHEEAAPLLERALTVYASSGLLGGRGGAPHFGLARISALQGDFAAEMAHYEAGLELAPTSARPHFDLGSAMLRKGRFKAADRHFEAATRLGFESPDLAAGRGIAAEQLGRHADAAGFYRVALAARPDWHAIANNLAWLLATAPEPSLRNPREALELAAAAVKASPQRDASLLDTLAVAHAAAGDFEEALAVATEAIGLARKGGGDAGLIAEMESRTALYRSRRAYTQSAFTP